MLWRLFKNTCLLLLALFTLVGCGQPVANAQKDVSQHSSRNYAQNTNLELYADSVALEQLPLKDVSIPLYKGDRVVIVDFAVLPDDATDSLWVKVAHTQDVQGWVRECDLKDQFVPTDSVSQFIYFFSRTHVPYFLVICACFVVFGLIRLYRRKVICLVWFHDIDSFYPLLLCVLLAFCAVLYESIQQFAPDLWEQYYFRPSLSPFQVPPLLGLFLAGLWSILAVFLALLNDVFRQLDPLSALFYLLGLLSVCIILYSFFILTTRLYVGYACWLVLLGLFIRKVDSLQRYYCGACGAPLKGKGVCPKCGALNQ